MAYNVVYKKSIHRDLKKFSKAEAIRILDKALTLNPESYPLLMYDARARIANGDAASVIERLEASARERSDDAQLWRLLADAYSGTRNVMGIYRARAEIFFLSGNEEKALEQLKLATDEARNNYPLTAKIQKRMRETTVGFAAASQPAVSEDNIFQYVQTRDFIDFGFEPEFIGRLPVRVVCQNLNVEDLFQILKSAEGSLILPLRSTVMLDERFAATVNARRSNACSRRTLPAEMRVN